MGLFFGPSEADMDQARNYRPCVFATTIHQILISGHPHFFFLNFNNVIDNTGENQGFRFKVFGEEDGCFHSLLSLEIECLEITMSGT